MAKLKELKQADIAGFFTVEEAANALGIKTTAIRNYLFDGKLTTYKFKTLTLLKREEVEDWKQRQERQKQRLA
jgi:excisionase family DNA binding protein